MVVVQEGQTMRVVAMDMGIKNFAFVQMENEMVENEDWGHVRWLDVRDLGGDRDEIYRALIRHLDQFRWIWETTDVVLIEQQLSRDNVAATRLASHTAAYFYHQFPRVPVMEYSAQHKTRLLGADRGLSYRQRKDFAVRMVMEHYREKDPVLCDWLEGLSKKDDVADCILMAATLRSSGFLLKKAATMIAAGQNNRGSLDSR